MMCMRSNEGKLECTERKINDKKVGWHVQRTTKKERRNTNGETEKKQQGKKKVIERKQDELRSSDFEN